MEKSDAADSPHLPKQPAGMVKSFDCRYDCDFYSANARQSVGIFGLRPDGDVLGLGYDSSCLRRVSFPSRMPTM